MDVLDIVRKRFVSPLLIKNTGNVGVELEFPMLNMNREPVDINIANALLMHFLNHGFGVTEITEDGNPAFLDNEYGDAISFDNSYNNIEFSMMYSDKLLDIKERFEKYFTLAQNFLKPYNYLITGMGINPYKKYIDQAHVDYGVYNMIDQYLHAYNCEKTHNYPDFPAYLSSVQTHLDINPNDMPKALTLMAQLDFVRGLLFSNSLAFDDTKTICFRDYLWENSAFGLCAKNTGKVDDEFNSLDDIAQDYLDRSMFNTFEDGEYKSFEPIILNDFFQNNDADNIKTFLSFRNVEVTARGTLEIRGDCSQPLKYAFVPPAFSLGIAHNLDNTKKILDSFLNDMKIKYKNSELRNAVINGNGIEGVSDEKLSEFLTAIIDSSVDGLKGRGLGEEKLIMPLYERAKALLCPANETKTRLKNGDKIENIILDYSKL